MKRSLSAILISASVVGLYSQAVAAPLKVYILAGQSNMEGHADTRTFDSLGMDPKTAPLLKEMRGPDGTPKVCERVWISYLTGDNTVKQGPLTAGFGAQGRGPKIGPEFTFGITLEKQVKGPILLIKTAWGGKSLHTDFRPPSAATEEKPVGEYYTLMVNHVKTVLRDIRQVIPDYNPEDGYDIAGFVWFQGWNDMVARDVYPNRGKPGGYALYTDLLADFIRDVRKEFAAPKMPFVIGVMGVGGPLDLENPGRYTAIHDGFRKAMAAPANMPEFKGNVVAVLTEKYWDPVLGELDERWGKVKGKNRELSNDKTLTKEQRQKALDEFTASLFTPEELKLRDVGISNAAFHYLGSAKIMAQIGRAFAEALTD
ncbi:MAG: sialate O-acetylesterase [Lentisphaeria bacterium]|nr:sialate O-acetylesterase [Lentisphaeria bacterium]